MSDDADTVPADEYNEACELKVRWRERALAAEKECAELRFQNSKLKQEMSALVLASEDQKP